MRRQAVTVGSTGGHLPPNLTGLMRETPAPALDNSYTSIVEARMMLFSPVRQLIAQTGIDPRRDIDIVVTVCTVFNPVPSMASMVVNEFKLRRDVKTYHLGGMACSAGAVAVGLIQDLLKATPNANALLVTHENATAGAYTGRHVEFLGVVGLMRQGSAAMLFSNKRSMAKRAKYRLQHHVRVHLGADDAGFNCMGRADDGDSVPGVFFNSDVPTCAMKAVTAAITRIVPKILTPRQMVAAIKHELKRRKHPEIKPFAPVFSDCVDHFALHPGIHAMLKGFMKGLKIEPAKMMPSFAALRDYANTSSSSTWYVMDYIETIDGVKKGDTIMQLGVGAGVKCGVSVYKALRTFKTAHPSWAHLNGVPVTEADLPLPLHGRLKRPDEEAGGSAPVAAPAAEGGDVMAESVELAAATGNKLEGLLQGPSRTAQALAAMAREE